MFIIYDLIFLIIAIIFLPIYLFKGKFHRDFFKRFGILPKDVKFARPIWIHTVSVGEVMAARGLIEGLKRVYPEKQIVISTVTPAGNRIAQDIAKEKDFVTYLPLDFSFIVRSVIDRINPCIFIIAETEIWPNLISYLFRKKIPVVIVNGRISDFSLKGYLGIKFLVKPILERISIFCVQTKRDADRFLRLGVLKEKIRVTGNMKFDSAVFDLEEKDLARYRQSLCLSSNDLLFVAGSTHPGEEEIILDVYKELLRDYPNLNLLIAPRHPQRSKDIAGLASRFGFRSVFISELAAQCPTCNTKPIFILDSIGQLIYFYGIADIVFVGKSLIKKGGHNILEPAYLSKPVLFGPHMLNFKDITELFLENKAGIMVENPQDLKANIAILMDSPAKRIELGRLARDVVLRNQGATERSLERIRKYIVSD